MTHVSSLIGVCARQAVLMQREDRGFTQKVTGGHRVMWRIGRAVEAHIRDQFIQANRFANVFGIWKCVCAHTSHRGFHPADTTCQRCNGRLDHYHELTLVDPDTETAGNPDLLVFARNRYAIVEIKSMNHDQFSGIEAPLGDHVFQAGMYRKLMNGLGYPVHEQVSIVYCTKQFKYGSPYKEYIVDVTTPELDAVLTDALASAKTIKGAKSMGTLPDRVVCPNPTCTRAKNCPVKESCWS